MRWKESSPARSSPTSPSTPSTVRSRRTAGISLHWARNSRDWAARFARFGRSFSTKVSFLCKTGATRSASTCRDLSSPARAVWSRLRSSALIMGGENDLARLRYPLGFSGGVLAQRGIDHADQSATALRCPRIRRILWQGTSTIPIPVDQIIFPGGDLSIVTNFEYRITIYGPVAIGSVRGCGHRSHRAQSQLQIAQVQYEQV